MHGTLLAVRLLRNALEKEILFREIANCDISVASQWMVRSGMELYREARNGSPLNDDPVMRNTGPLYKGKPGLCPERWLFWKSRFSKVTDEVDEEVVKMAQQAVCEMERAEKVMKKHAMDLYTDEIDHRPTRTLKSSAPAGSTFNYRPLDLSNYEESREFSPSRP
jgi:uncharacterized protein DUF3632